MKIYGTEPEQEQKIRQAESESRIKDAVIAVIVAILLIITSFSIHSVRQRHALNDLFSAYADGQTWGVGNRAGMLTTDCIC